MEKTYRIAKPLGAGKQTTTGATQAFVPITLMAGMTNGAVTEEQLRQDATSGRFPVDLNRDTGEIRVNPDGVIAYYTHHAGVNMTAPAIPQIGFALHPDEMTILRALQKAGTTLTAEALESATGLPDRTIRRRLKNLESNKFTHRPRGVKGGSAITSKGASALNSPGE